MKIYKYTLDLIDEQVVDVPAGSRVVHVHEQNGGICVWLEWDGLGTATTKKRFFVVGTGNHFPSSLRYCGTAHVGPFVWHVYE